MFKRVFLLNGLAIVAVVCNHASSWGEMAMFWWADRWRSVSVPIFDMDATLPYYFLLAERKLAVFGVPAFLFFSGFFLSYASAGKTSSLSWKTVRTRVQALLIPYALWFAVWIFREYLNGVTHTPADYVTRLFLGWPTGAYWYIPVICVFYLLSPFLAPLARSKPYKLLLIVGALHLLDMSVSYLKLGLELVGTGAPGAAQIAQVSYPLHIHLALYFALGLVVGAHRREFGSRLKGRAWVLALAALVLGALALFESEMIYRSTSLDWRSATQTLPTSLYALAIILLFLAMGEIPKAISSILHKLGSRMFGIYLVHRILLEFTARATQKFIPGLLASTVLFQLVLVVAAVAGSMLIMEAVQRSPLRQYSKYLFG